jgi:fructose-1,6-bisphosphatase/inositol monophosphatase family enzyme
MGKLNGVRKLYGAMEAASTGGSRVITGLSIHYMAALVACGEFAGAFFGGKSPHDMTAGKIIVEEAGGRASDLFGKTPERFDRDMDGQLLSNGLVHDELLELMSRASGNNA